MKISTILDHIDNGHMALPEFQRGYVWNRDQVRGLFDSLYRRHPVGGLLVWATESSSAQYRGEGQVAPGIVKLLLDGQQRITSLYGVIRGKAPKFFDGNARAFTDLRFHLGQEVFAFYQPLKMQDDPLWIDVSELMQQGDNALGEILTRLSSLPNHATTISASAGRISRLLGIRDIDLHIEEVTGQDKTLEVVVDIFNRVNSGGTKLSQGDLALAKICADWPEARNSMKDKVKEWTEAGYCFDLDFLLRCVNTVLTGEARFHHLHNVSAEEVEKALSRTTRQVDKSLNLIAGRLGLDHDRVLFGRYGITVMARYLDTHGPTLNESDRDKLLFWFIQAAMWGRFSGSTESFIDQDLAALDGPDGGLDKLLDQLRLWHGTLTVLPEHFSGWSQGARFYPVLYMITRMGEARDWGSGIPLKSSTLGKMSKLEVHHIFPKSQLYKRGLNKARVNAVANFCFLTKETNLDISNRLPEEYFPKVEAAHPGSLASQWIPSDPELWKMENFPQFLQERQRLLAAEVNRRMEELLHGDTRWLRPDISAVSTQTVAVPASPTAAEGTEAISEEGQLRHLMYWMQEQQLPPGTLDYELTDPETGQQLAVLDLAWPAGVQEELTPPVAVLIDEPQETLAAASAAGFRCFSTTEEFMGYVEQEILGTTSSMSS